MKSFTTLYFAFIEVTRGEVRWHMKNACFLQITKPKELDGRGKKRKFDETDMATLKKELKKKKASPKKVAKRLSDSPAFGKTINEKTIRRRMKLQGNRQGNADYIP